MRKRPIILNYIKFSDIKGNLVVREEHSLTFGSHELAEIFIQERKKYWQNILNLELIIEPMQNETIAEIEILEIFDLTAKEIGVNPAWILRKVRIGKIIEARRIAINICFDLGLSEYDIGRAIERDRSTALYHMRKFREFCETEPGYKEKYDSIKDAVLMKLNGEYTEDGSGRKIESHENV